MFSRFDARFLSHLKRQKKLLLAGLGCSGVAAGFELLQVAFIYWVAAAVRRQETDRLALLSLLVVAMYIAKYWFTFGQTYFLSRAANRVTADLRKQIFEKLHRLPMAFFNRQRVGVLQSILSNDVAIVQTGVSSVRDVVNSPVFVVGGIIALFVLNWKLTLISLIGLPPVLAAIRFTSKKVRRGQQEIQQVLGNMTAVMQESLSAVRVVKSFSAEEREVTRFGEQVEKAFKSTMRVMRRIATLKPLIELFGAFALAAVIWFGGILAAAGEIQIETLIAFAFALDKIKNGTTGLGNLSNTYSQVVAATDRIYREVLDVKAEIHDEEDAITPPHAQGLVEFRNVSFSYPDGTQALSGVSFAIEPGTSAALVGRSGAGKSTVADLLLRFYDPTEGQILFDGVDIKRLDSAWLRRQIGVVPQQTLLFAATVHDNIAFGRTDAEEAEVKAAACSAHAHEFIQAMPEGYGAILGERGIRLSGGEMQRIAIARALLIDPKVLLLDEATSALDAVSERKVQEALDEIMRGRTTLLIAHRLTSAARADQIIVLNNGVIVEKGSHADLMASNGAYAGMYRAFNSGVLDDSIG